MQKFKRIKVLIIQIESLFRCTDTSNTYRGHRIDTISKYQTVLVSKGAEYAERSKDNLMAPDTNLTVYSSDRLIDRCSTCPRLAPRCLARSCVLLDYARELMVP
jgi:hypothetical protein